MAGEVILMNPEDIRQSAAFQGLPLLLQVTMLQSGVLPRTEAEVRALARRMTPQ